MSRFRLLLTAFVAVAGLLLAACGDDDDVSTDDNAQDGGTDEESTDDGENAASFGGDGDCGFLVEFARDMEDFDPSALFTSEEAVDLGELFATVADGMQDVASAAPDEISDQFQTVADGFATVVSELEGVVLDPNGDEQANADAMAAMMGVGEALDTEEFEAASNDIEEWVQTNCGDLADTLDFEGFGA